MAFSELSRPWSARGHSNPRGGLLLCHGFTGSPQSLRPWAEHHAAHGWEVELPLLPGHGTRWEDLESSRWTQWYSPLRRHVLDLSEDLGPIAVGGLSMGCALTLALAADPDLRGRIAALVVVNPGLTLPPAAAAARLLARARRTLPGIGSDLRHPEASEEAYDRTPVRSVAELRTLFTRVRRELGAVTVPVLVTTSPQDRTVPPGDSDRVAAGVRGEVQRLRLPSSGHVAPLDHDADLLFEASEAFLRREVPLPEDHGTKERA